MNRILLKGKNIKYIFILVTLLILSTTITILSISRPATTTNQIDGNTTQMETSYDYKATITPNILYPNGGTVKVGTTIFKKITTAIPVTMKSVIHSQNQVIAKGTHETKLVIKAGDIWERTFPLEQKQTFEQKGTEIAVLASTYKIDLEKIQPFITQVENETGIQPAQYTLEVVPNILGTIRYAGKERDFQVQDKLVFQYSNEDIILASGKSFTSTMPFTKAQITTNTFNLFGLTLPLNPVRIISTLLSILFLITIIFAYRNGKTNYKAPIASQMERINKKYGNRIIPVSQKINIAQKSIITLDSFKSVIKIADERELPVLFYKDKHQEIGIYFIIDGDYLYSYETSKTDYMAVNGDKSGSDIVYASR